jgi:pimeloyl-ACP methyl ester carboxylesterase
MDLYFRKSGSGQPLVILHGLYGSSDNWYSIGRMLAEKNTIYLVDQRNHGNSPHDPVHSYEAMAEDLFNFMQKHISGRASIIGHSMGGKTALLFGLNHPELVSKMIIVDISPLGYDVNDASAAGNQHLQIIKALSQITPGSLISREEADELLKQDIRHFFPWARVETIADSGHWVHAEQPARFLEVVNAFLNA